MTYETFKDEIVIFLTSRLGASASISLEPLAKNNGIVLDGLIISQGSINIAPAIYLNPFYEDYISGTPFSEICESILSIYYRHRPEKDIDTAFFTDVNRVRDHLIYKLIHYERNAALLKEVPHQKFLDLAIVYCLYIRMDPIVGNATILIRNQHLEQWGISPSALHALAEANTPRILPADFRPMEEVLASLPFHAGPLPDHAPGRISEAYVLSNDTGSGGAAAILYPGLLADYANRLHTDFLILPSSIHEMILLPVKSPDEFPSASEVVREVNKTDVLFGEVLADHAYYYHRESGRVLERPCTQERYFAESSISYSCS